MTVVILKEAERSSRKNLKKQPLVAFPWSQGAYVSLLWDTVRKILESTRYYRKKNPWNLTLIVWTVFYATCLLRIHRRSEFGKWQDNLIRHYFDDFWPVFIVLAYDNSNRAVFLTGAKLDFQWTITRDWQGGFWITSRGNHKLHFSAISILFSVRFPSEFMWCFIFSDTLMWKDFIVAFFPHDCFSFQIVFHSVSSIQLLTLLPSA